MILISLLEKNHHRVADVKANVAAVIVCDTMAALLYDEAVPILLKSLIEFFFYFARNV